MIYPTEIEEFSKRWNNAYIHIQVYSYMYEDWSQTLLCSVDDVGLWILYHIYFSHTLISSHLRWMPNQIKWFIVHSHKMELPCCQNLYDKIDLNMYTHSIINDEQ